jgi:hypothetical protein
VALIEDIPIPLSFSFILFCNQKEKRFKLFIQEFIQKQECGKERDTSPKG